MKITAIKMLALGVAALGVLGGAVALKQSCAAAEGVRANEATLNSLDAAVKGWAQKAAAALKEEIPEAEEATSGEDGNVAALGASQSVPARKEGSPMVWLVVALGLVAGASIVMMASMKQYRPATREAEIGAAVDEIVRKRSGRSKSRRAKTQRHAKVAKSSGAEFDDIARAVDEIISQHRDDE